MDEDTGIFDQLHDLTEVEFDRRMKIDQIERICYFLAGGTKINEEGGVVVMKSAEDRGRALSTIKRLAEAVG